MYTTTDTQEHGFQFVLYRGEIVAYVTAHRIQLTRDLEARDERDPERQFAWFMAQYALASCRGQLDFPYTDEDARMFARRVLLPRELLDHELPNPCHTALAIGVPVDELLDRRTWFIPGAVAQGPTQATAPSTTAARFAGRAAAPRHRKRLFSMSIFNRH